jgi:PAS domain S-box-containing protein
MVAVRDSQAPRKERLDEPLYNSRLLENYLEYIKRFHPDVDRDKILTKASLKSTEVIDPAHWLSQRQVDKFYDAVIEETGDNEIARKVGRYSAFSDSSGILRRYIGKFLTPGSAYWMIQKISGLLTKAFTFESRKAGRNKVEVIVTIEPGVREQPYQCANRLGMLEALSSVFTGKFASIEHPSCCHSGAEKCIYLVSWEITAALKWKLVRNYTLLGNLVILFGGYFVLSLVTWLQLALAFSLMALVISLYSSRLERNELRSRIEKEGDSAESAIEEMKIRYDNAMLVQEIGQATSTFLQQDDFLKQVASAMERRLGFDRGMILVADRNKELLCYGAGFGYNAEQEEKLKANPFSLANPTSEGIFVLSYRKQESFLIRDIEELEHKLSQKSRELAREMNVKSMICVPIVYEYNKESLGIIAVDNIKSKRPLSQSDIGLLKGIAAQTALTLINARSFQLLQESERKYRELVENASTIILRINVQGKIIFFNEFAQMLFGYKQEEILGRPITEFIFSSENEPGDWISELISASRSSVDGTVLREENHLVKDDREIVVSWIFKPIYGEEGSIKEILCVGMDITRLKKAEEEKRALETQLAHTQRIEAIGTLAGGIAHDFNNILSAIIGYTELALYVSKDEEKRRKQMLEVLKAGQRAKDLVRQILSFSRHTDEEKKPIELAPVIKEAVKMLRASLPATIQIVQDFKGDPDIVLADPTRIHQIVLNLCTNAHHAMLRSGGVLTLRLRSVQLNGAKLRSYPELREGKYLVFTVSDTGHGMDRSIMERIFEPYFTTKEKGMGTGLGLAVVHGIVKGYGGAIRVKSTPGKGTTFDILLPCAERKAEVAGNVEKALEGGTERILLVDDESAIVEITSQMLTSMGYKVAARTDPLEALELFLKNPYGYDLLITDMTMPHLTGDILAKRVLQIRPDMPVILCSGYSENLLDESINSIGIREIVSKPLVLGELATTVRRALDEGK